MKAVLHTAPVLEPIEKDDLKLHLRLDSGSFADNIDETQSIAPGSHGTSAGGILYTHEGAKVEVLGYTAVVVANYGILTVGGVVDIKIQESDDDVTWTDWTGGAFTQVTISATASTQEKAYTGTKRYIRTVARVVTQNSEFSTTVIRLTATSIEDDLLDAIITAATENVEDITRRALLTQTWDYYLDKWPAGRAIKLPFGNLASVTSISWKDTDGVETNLAKTITAFAASGTSPATKTAVTSAAHGFSAGDVVSISGTTSYDGGWEISNVTTNTFDILVIFVADDATGYASNDYLVEKNGEGIGRIVLPYGESWLSDILYPSNPIKIRFVCGWTTAALVPYKIKTAIKMICAGLYEHREDFATQQQGNVKDNPAVMRLLNSARLWDEF